MLYTEIIARQGEHDRHGETVLLTWAERQKRRIRATTAGGRDVGISLPEGGVLRDGDLLGPSDLPPLVVQAVAEPVLVIRPRSRQEMGRVAHQIGNRHMQAWITEDAILVAEDPVLEAHLASAGVPFRRELLALEGGPVGALPGGHHHEHEHDHDHAHTHDHAHGR
ncbi:MAG TPA: hypothetical protein VGK74_23765 [Symbiobacteriaceae bacterium]|jgi:urease accessory protein